MTELEHYINSYFGIEANKLQLISTLFVEQKIKKNEYFLQSGNACDKLSFIKSGMLRIFVNTDEKEVTQWISTKGYFVTDLASLIFGSPARWNIQALSDTEIYTISKTNYLKIANEIPEWHQLEKLFIARCFTILEDRIFSHLSMSAEERYNLFFEKNRELFQQVPQQYLASLLGMTPETFSRIRKKQLE